MQTTTSRVLAALVIALSSLAGVPAASADVDVSTCAAAPEVAGPACGLAGDDDGDGVIREDESGWDCATMGNLVCGVKR